MYIYSTLHVLLSDVECCSLTVCVSVLSLCAVPAPVCSDVPDVEDDMLVVRWTYTHTGGLTITSTDVYFNPDTSPELRTSFSNVSGSVVTDTEGSIPLPEAGLHYQFTVKTENSVGTTEADCPPLRLDIGEIPNHDVDTSLVTSTYKM